MTFVPAVSRLLATELAAFSGACSLFRLRLSAFTFCDCDFRLFFESISTFNLITMLGGLADRSVDADVHCFIIEHLGVGTRYRQLSVTMGLMSSTGK